ncbi:MAG: molybdate transport system permease protein [Clostridia bacterium]|jgi:molybdate transport system permease protein|nr:NifC-like ABC-type porter [Clostridiales bacterium]MDK2985752.1 molybdate transport system permease protein [Clostridia bacterium]
MKWLMYFCCAVCAFFLISPLVALLLGPWFQVVAALGDPVVVQALITSLKSTAVSLVIIILFGLPASYVMARYQFPGKGFLDTVFELPLVLPPAVAGLLLLITFGRNGPLGRYLYDLGFQIPFTLTAVVMAQIFVAAPIFIKSARNGLQGVDRDLEITAATLGDTPWQTFWKVTLPLSWNTLLSGAILAWARALAEFGATIMFAGNLPGKTQTLPLAIYTAMEKDLDLSLAIAVILVLVSFSVLTILKLSAGKGWREL